MGGLCRASGPGGRLIRFSLNGKTLEADTSPNTTLLDFLRQEQRLTGTKEGCAEGDCGACTVALLDPDAVGGPAWRAINSCLTLLPMVNGRTLVTVEGLSDGETLHPAQQAVVERLGSQCGYCTPGVVMSLFESCYRDDAASEAAQSDQMCGNLCRCTGYRPIQDAAKDVAGCRPADRFAAALVPAVTDPSGAWTRGDESWSMPDDWSVFFDAVEQEEAQIVCGATDLGLQVTQRGVRFSTLVSVESLPGLRDLHVDGDVVHIGAAVPLTDLERFAAEELPVVARMLRFFGSRQIKHRATLGGNLCNASPIGDMAPVMLALDATLVLRSRAGERELPIREFFLGYRQTALAAGEVVAAIRVRKPGPSARVGAYKVSRRREMDISAVALGAWVEVSDGLVIAARLGFGGMAATPKRASALEAALVGQPWTIDAVERLIGHLDEDFQPLSDHRGSAWYRQTVAKNLVRGFVEETEHASFQALPDRPLSTIVQVSK